MTQAATIPTNFRPVDDAARILGVSPDWLKQRLGTGDVDVPVALWQLAASIARTISVETPLAQHVEALLDSCLLDRAVAATVLHRATSPMPDELESLLIDAAVHGEPELVALVRSWPDAPWRSTPTTPALCRQARGRLSPRPRKERAATTRRRFR